MSLINKIADGFYSNFIAGDMYQWLLDGLKNTLLITIFAVILGIIIGFFVAIVRASHDKSGSFKILKILVGALAFGINSGAYVAETVRSGIMAVDNGQFEAGRSLGLNYRQTMRLIIIPQAFKNVLPALVNEFIALMKETSIIGYIGMQDLTKGAMMIQSRTFDAFWPLLAAAAIYLVLVMALTACMNKLEKRLRTNER